MFHLVTEKIFCSNLRLCIKRFDLKYEFQFLLQNSMQKTKPCNLDTVAWQQKQICVRNICYFYITLFNTIYIQVIFFKMLLICFFCFFFHSAMLVFELSHYILIKEYCLLVRMQFLILQYHFCLIFYLYHDSN